MTHMLAMAVRLRFSARQVSDAKPLEEVAIRVKIRNCPESHVVCDQRTVRSFQR
jgi:hypothetical protein